MRYIWHPEGWLEVPWTLPAPRVALISDTMQAARHQVTGEVLDSKSRFRQATRDAGCVELGNDVPVGPRPMIKVDGVRNDIMTAIRDLRDGMAPPRAETIADAPRVYERPAGAITTRHD